MDINLNVWITPDNTNTGLMSGFECGKTKSRHILLIFERGVKDNIRIVPSLFFGESGITYVTRSTSNVTAWCDNQPVCVILREVV